MKKTCVLVACVLLLSFAAAAQATEEIENYLVAPMSMNKTVTITTTDGQKFEGTVIKGDDDKITVSQAGRPVEVTIDRISTIRFRRAKRNAKAEFVGSLIGGVGFGIGGAAVGKEAGKALHTDGGAGTASPMLGGVVFGLAGGQLGKMVARHGASEEVTLKVVQGPPAKAPATGQLLRTPPAAAVRVEPADLRR